MNDKHYGWSRLSRIGIVGIVFSIIMMIIVHVTLAQTEPQIEAGNSHTIALKSDGTVWAWGSNSDGQLGDGTYTDRKTPVQVIDLIDVTDIAGGGDHTIALVSGSTVWAWGSNDYGQLGDGTTTDITTSVQVSGLSSVTAVAAGDNHTIALKPDGRVWACGSNDYGQLGDGTNTNSTTTVQVSSFTVYTSSTGTPSIAAGGEHTIALKSDGTVWGCGSNDEGQLVNGTNTNRRTPVQVSNFNVTSTTPTPTPTPAKGKIFGYVVNVKGTPIKSVLIRLIPEDGGGYRSTYTDEDGFFEFEDLDADDYVIVAKKKGYRQGKKTVEVEEGKEKEIKIKLYAKL